MSYQIAIDTLHLRPTPRLAHTDYCSNDALIRKVEQQTGKRFDEAWELDFLWWAGDSIVDWSKRGRITDMGHAEFLEDGRDFQPVQTCPFTDPEQVLEFDAVKEYGPVTIDELVPFFEKSYQDRRKAQPYTLNTGGYYRTIVSGAITAFGWDMLLEAAADQDRFEKVLDSFFRLSLVHYQAWAETSIEAFMSHDDFVWSEGPFMHPDFYRRVIIPRYAELWKVLRDAGKKVLFTSDADYSMFLDDLAAAGVDAFVFEPMVDLDLVVSKFGQTHGIVGSKVDCRTMTFGTTQDIQRQMDATFEVAFDCPGFFFAVGNHIPSNVPVENAEFYIDYLRRNWNR